MADEELVRILRQGSEAWAAWRQKNPGISLDLSDADLGKTDLVRRVYADLQNKDVRCWLASEDMKIGDKILDTIDEAIRLRDKVLLVLSETSIASDWVEDEVTKAYAEERQRRMTVVFPICLDDAVFTTNEAWARKLRDNRYIGDFRCWKEHDAYQKALNRLLRDLRIETT